MTTGLGSRQGAPAPDGVPPAAGPFDVCGPLPTGTTVLEASAGTGKTFTIAALATRYVAEGVAALPELMLVTFGRAATQELRERVRDRFVLTEAALAQPASARGSRDGLVRLLAAGDDDEVALRRARLTAALAGFDAATIATTHQWCLQVLAGLGVAGDSDAGDTLVEHVDDLVVEATDDLYVRVFARPSAPPPPFGRAEALTIARAAVDDPRARLEPRDVPADSPAGRRRRLAEAVRAEVGRRKRDRRLLGYDDLLARLADVLADPARGPVARARLRGRYRVVLVDEFQDTDAVQWEILHRAFHGLRTLVLIGDPKQAIYAFRGADVVSYLDAVRVAHHHRTLARNWRSDERLLDGLDVLLGRAALGDERITVRPVEAAHAGTRLVGAPVTAPVRLRVVRREQARTTQRGLTTAASTRRLVAEDVAGDVAALLARGARLRGPLPATALADEVPEGGERNLRPGDVAVLVRTNAQAATVRDALHTRGVPAVLAGAGSVFTTAPAREWLVLFEALEQPHRQGRVAAAALTDFLGRTATELATAGDSTLDELGPLLRSWAGLLAARGVAALLEAVSLTQGLPQRLLGQVDGERRLTDLRHVGQVLHRAAVEGQLGLTALAEWLRARIADAETETDAERSRRLESDAEAVQVVTVHRSKGLEFPVVHVPFAWDRYVPARPDLLRLHDDEGARVRDVGGPDSPGWRDRRRRHEAEEAGEDLRLLYVALTRAQCQVVTWWAPSTNTPGSALHRLLFGLAGPGRVPAASCAVPEDDDAADVLRRLADRSRGAVAVEPAEPDPHRRWAPPRGKRGPLEAAVFDRGVDTAWRRTSYSGLTAAAHAAAHAVAHAAGPGVESEPEAGDRDDEPATGPDPAPTSRATGPDEPLRAVPSPMADLPSGAAFGTLVHGLLETLDTTAPDLRAELEARAVEQVAFRAPDLDPGLLAHALLPVVGTPLGPLADGRALRDVAPGDRLAELDFELPLAGGDVPPGRPSERSRTASAVPTLGDLAPLLREHLPSDDPLAAYPERLDDPALRDQPLRGYLTGSIDAVLRLPGPRYLVVDFKTNWLGGGGPAGAEPLTAWHYRREALVASMVEAHYPLQALLYSVALHRYLRWRQPGYDPERHLGGVLYLYLRGMCGPGVRAPDGSPTGVLDWRPPAALVEALSRLLDGECR